MSEKIFQSNLPSPEDLIEYAINQKPLNYTEDKRQWTSLHSIVASYLNFVAHNEGEFWISDPERRRFPEDHFRESLQKFFANSSVWRCSSAKYLKQEHLRVLFFIAALRYAKRLQKPQQQIKFQKGNKSQGDTFDLFVFHRRHNSPAFALQIRLLTHEDLDLQGNIRASYRGSEELGKGIQTFDQYTEASINTLKSCIFALNKHSMGERKTQGCVILVTPSKMAWYDCGLYHESLTSELVNQPQRENIISVSGTSSRQSYQSKQAEIPMYNPQNINSIQFAGPPLPKPQHVWSENNSVASSSKKVNFSEIPSRAPSVCPIKEKSVYTISNSYKTNWMEHNQPHFNQMASQLLQGLASAQALSGNPYQPNLNQPMIFVIADPNIIASFQNPSVDPISFGVRRRPVNGFKAKSTL